MPLRAEDQGPPLRRFSAFLVVGGVAAIANVGSRAAFSLVAGYSLSILLGYLVGVTTAFILNRRYVFRGATGNAHAQYLRFAAVNVAAFGQVWLVSMLFARFLFPAISFHWHPETVAHAIGVLSPVLTSYFLHKRFSFRIEE